MPTGRSVSPAGAQQDSRPPFRPAHVEPVPLTEIAEILGLPAEGLKDASPITGTSLDSRAIAPGDLYFALPGASRHGADFALQAVDAGATAVLTDHDGAQRIAHSETLSGVPVLVLDSPRRAVGPVSALVYGTRPGAPGAPVLVGVTGTNGKTTTTYFTNSLLSALGHRTGLIGTIEISAGGERLPSKLTTPESTDVHALLALMREQGVTAASMEVSSHAIEFGRVDGVRYDAVGFSNLTQDHLDLHGTMEEYYAVKARLFTPERAARGVVTVDDAWGRRLAAEAKIPIDSLASVPAGGADGAPDADWTVGARTPSGIGTAFELRHRDGAVLRVRSGLPGAFNVANAALATLLVVAAGAPLDAVQEALDAADPFTVEVPGRMQLVGTAPTAIVDFAHNADALERALEAVRPVDGSGRLIVVFGATGQRDAGKRPIMGAVAVRGADVVVVTDDDPHDEEAAGIRAEVIAGARGEDADLGLRRRIDEVAPRAAAIRHAVALAEPADVILVAGRGHEVVQEVKGVNIALDDRLELAAALSAQGFPVVGPAPGFSPQGGNALESDAQ
ncbi:UDP-N-acetylmuramoyl-L-alanyl-D-glutamate--2,6-diaminopimelate ligase [Sinomonas notoginsengisoli]|uniref:UDP-N-acetylmuramoyl-L-alanyl-D-glutamate--2, 6-diaminopimelate ligase n=1 Tax=Sinomonas notoginsengisoli TaxID=1457311 RepID=UPI001F338557|nr:UDP-N-acetylmuramoyl-L-alanyl-D-glutamate--2,6-diaminopimelate ligase [Sinomonas notoginsengisoli]